MRILRRVVATALVSLPLPLLADTPVDFSGEWVATHDSASTNAKTDASDAPHSGGRGSGGHGHGMGGGGMGGGGMGGGHHARQGTDAVSRGSSGNTGAALADPRLHARTLIIRQSDVVFDIAADGQRVAYRFDNRNNYGAQYGGTVNLTWSAPEMVIEVHPDGGGSLEEHYRLSADGKKLTLLLRTQDVGGEGAREVTREFVHSGSDAAPAGNSPTLP